jgi:uncharacterized protein YdhG (YjbR/CyaY superfamily)
MQSKSTTVAQYLDELPPDRRAALEAVRATIRANMDPQLEEGMQYGMIGYYVPHRVFPQGYHCDPKQPLPYAALASQKQYMSIYLMTCYMSGDDAQWLRDAWAAAGKKLDMGKSCIRFKRIEDVPLDVLGEAIRRVSVADHLAHYTAALATPRPTAASPRSAKPAAKTAAKRSKK